MTLESVGWEGIPRSMQPHLCCRKGGENRQRLAAGAGNSG